jgi:hypothetical protein
LGSSGLRHQPHASLLLLLLLLHQNPLLHAASRRGYGAGAGIRIDSPLGPVRLEYAWNDQRSGRFHVALGYD